MKYNKKLLMPAIIAVSAVLITVGTVTFMNMNKKSQPYSPIVNVENLDLSNVENSDLYQGTLISRYSVSLQPQVAGQIAEIKVKAGDKVSAGQTLIVIDRRKQEAALNFSKAEAESMKSAVVQSKKTLNTYEVQQESLVSNYHSAKKQFERYSDLYSKKVVSQQELEQYTDAYNKAKADLAANKAQISAQKAAVQSAISNYEKASYSIKEQGVQLAYHNIVAPYSGMIGDIPVKVGEYVTPQSKLLSITQNNQLEINVGLPAEKVFDIKMGLPIQVLDSNGKVVVSSKISFVSPKVDTDTQTVLVKAIVQNPQGVLKADQSVKTRVVYSSNSGILVPAEAITHMGGQDFAFVVIKKDKQNLIKQQPVSLGELQREKYVVKSGLNQGDCVVTQGVQKIYDGASVTIAAEEKK